MNDNTHLSNIANTEASTVIQHDRTPPEMTPESIEKPDQEDLDASAATLGRPKTEEERAYHYLLAQLYKARRLGIKEDDDTREERLRELGDHIGYRLMAARGPYFLLDRAFDEITMDALDLDGVEEFLIEALEAGDR
jgi:hypothetical protein